MIQKSPTAKTAVGDFPACRQKNIYVVQRVNMQFIVFLLDPALQADAFLRACAGSESGCA